MTGGERITWTRGRHAVLVGKVGGQHVFTIVLPFSGDGSRGLRSTLPGFGDPRPFANETEAKAAAEAELVRFVELMGASFKEAAGS
jgi:hypothetical protein